MSFSRRLALGIVASLAAMLLCASGAAAAVPGADIASNLAKELSSWAKVIIVPTAALMALPALFKRDIGHALVTLVIVVLVGMFAFDAGGVEHFVTQLSDTVLNK